MTNRVRAEVSRFVPRGVFPSWLIKNGIGENGCEIILVEIINYTLLLLCHLHLRFETPEEVWILVETCWMKYPLVFSFCKSLLMNVDRRWCDFARGLVVEISWDLFCIRDVWPSLRGLDHERSKTNCRRTISSAERSRSWSWRRRRRL